MHTFTNLCLQLVLPHLPLIYSLPYWGIASGSGVGPLWHELDTLRINRGLNLHCIKSQATSEIDDWQPLTGNRLALLFFCLWLSLKHFIQIIQCRRGIKVSAPLNYKPVISIFTKRNRYWDNAIISSYPFIFILFLFQSVSVLTNILITSLITIDCTYLLGFSCNKW